MPLFWLPNDIAATWHSSAAVGQCNVEMSTSRRSLRFRQTMRSIATEMDREGAGSVLRASLLRGLRGPLMTGCPAFFCAIAAVALPTIGRAAISGSVIGCEFTPYLPFVLVASVLTGWLWASLVALASVAILGGLFFGPALAPCFISSAGTFLLGSAMIIGIAVVVRRAMDAGAEANDESSGGVILTVDRGEVWASWQGQSRPIRLGPKLRVFKMMRDFLAQSGDDSTR